MTDYSTFLERRHHTPRSGLGADPPRYLFPFQRDMVKWALDRGRGAIFADCGLGKTPMQLAWADAVAKARKSPVLILTPLAVAEQTVREAQKFGVTVYHSKDGTVRPRGSITVTNYERLHYFNPSDFCGVVCDESSAIKAFNGERRRAVTDFMRKVEFRLLCTATAAPNDYTELGTSSEALGELGHMDMLGRFFVNDQNTIKPMIFRHRGRDFSALDDRAKWRFKGHAEKPFWRWVASWAKAARRPSDLGYPDDGFILPDLTETQHAVKSMTTPDGMLFNLPAVSLEEQRAERRRTIGERCDKVAELVEHDRIAVVWCHLNDEADRLESIIPDAVQIAGRESDEAKESKFLDFAQGNIRVLVTKPSIGAWGLNWQHCSHMTVFPSHSYEQYYQAVRRCWRYGQEHPVTVDIVTTEGEQRVLDNLQRKSRAADRMFTELVEAMNSPENVVQDYTYRKSVEVPSWL